MAAGIDWVALTPHGITDADFSGPPDVGTMYTVVYRKALPYTAAFLGIWLLFVGLFSALGFGSTMCGAKRGSWALKSAMEVHHIIVGPLALYALWEDPVIFQMYTCFGCSEAAALMNRSPGVASLAARALTPITLGYFLGDLILLPNWQLTKSGMVETGLMIFHHIASLIVWPAALYFDWVARYVLIMLSFEWTSFWLTGMWMFSTAGKKSSIGYIFVSLVFTLSFMIFRVVGTFPQLVALAKVSPWSHEVEFKAEPKGIHEYCWIFSASLVAPHILNLFWGMKVAKGFFAFIGGSGKDKKKSEKKAK
eukprot:TRINITY_DN37415_c0_g1_i2.p1 TRINITY_DN37415_c0_g1~~TRINITY_DN37415_c0_g1_i2.p1  ORF type:complete len:308 (+),score=40.13 TRINITY_DN37415_c0_g1_i2:120-1043(+)